MLPDMAATFFAKLIPPCPGFPLDMTADERALMLQHVAYFGKQFELAKY